MPLEFYILISAIVSGTGGFLIAAVFASAKMRRIERQTWSAAERHYAARMAELIRR